MARRRVGLSDVGLTGQRIDERIAARYDDLPPQERRAADILLAHLDDLAMYRAAELAALAGVSKATMSRLFRTLGFDDFMQVRRHLRDLRDERDSAAAVSVSSLTNHLEDEIANLRSMLTGLDDSRLDAAVSLLAGARRVIVVGLGSSYPVAVHLLQQLGQAGCAVRLAPQPTQSGSDELVGLTANDVAVVAAFRRRPASLAQELHAFHNAGTPVVLLADPAARPLAARVAVWLECPLTTASSFDSYAAAMSVVTVLADGVMRRTSEPPAQEHPA